MSHPEGLQIALQRIAEEKEQGTGFLDLGQLGLTALPDELFDLDHLTGLNLGAYYWDEDERLQRAFSDIEPNQITGDLGRLTHFDELSSLSVSSIPIADLHPISKLQTLQALYCSGTQVHDLKPLENLQTLQTLHCSDTQVHDLKPLENLQTLKVLDCNSTQVHDLKPLENLQTLQALYCSGTQVHDLKPLENLQTLQTLHCSDTQVHDLKPLENLQTLKVLDCNSTQVHDLKPLENLQTLQALYCSFTQVHDLKPLENLQTLQSLHCSGTQVHDLKPLENLQTLQSLHCSGTQVHDLKPLENLQTLQKLDCRNTAVTELPEDLVWSPSLEELSFSSTKPTRIPSEILGKDCLERVRAHLRDLEYGAEAIPDTKVLVLGNGRIGKTQICRRLRGLEFEHQANSTHGIQVNTIPFEVPESEGLPDNQARLHLWDFGGQDLYHGTHGLFMKTRSIFLIVWTPESENTETYEYDGITFRNHRLPYWVQYVRHVSGPLTPIIVIQNQCESAEDEQRQPPVDPALLDEFRFCRTITYSAMNRRGHPTLVDAIQQAIQDLRLTQGAAQIGIGRLEVKNRLEEMRSEDSKVPPEQRTHRTLSVAEFEAMCRQTGQVSSPTALLNYLHAIGVVYYREGLFNDRILLDQQWALDAIYAVFNRETCYRPLLQLKGRFTRPLLDALVWGKEHGPEEQKVFLELMTSCGVAFVFRKDHRDDDQTEYIAPDLLPSRDAVSILIDGVWNRDDPIERITFELPFLHPAAIRSIISEIGTMAGPDIPYWKDGVCFYEETTQSRALIEQRPDPDSQTFGGQIVIEARSGRTAELLRRLHELVEQSIKRSGCGDWKVIEAPTMSMDSGRFRKIEGLEEDPDRSPLKPGRAQPDPGRISYCVSYAHQEPSNAVVDDLCTEAERRDVSILRDKDGLGLGESITDFMRQLAVGDRVFIILSEKYLKSPYCMFELFEVWRECRSDPTRFRNRIRVYRHDDANMLTIADRIRWAEYWETQFEEIDTLVRDNPKRLAKMAEKDVLAWRNMMKYADNVGDILQTIADTLLPRDFTEFVEHGFDDPPADS